MSKRTPDENFLNATLARLREVSGEGVVPLHEPEFAGAEWEMVKDCLDEGWVSSVGKYVDRFEAEVAQHCGARHGVALVNGTAALQIALLVAGVAPGDEVLIPTLSFVATANAVCHAGAVPHFVDVNATTLGIDPTALEIHLDRIAYRKNGILLNRETNRRLGAIVPMHTFGHPTEMDALLALAEAYCLPVVEDAAEALGSLYKGRPCGGFGRISALSFNGNKILTTGGGGAVVTNDPELARRAKHLTTTAKVPHRWAFEHDEIAFNYRLPNLNAALGCAQLAQLDDRLEKKRRVAAGYIEVFKGFSGASIFEEPVGSRSNYWLNTLILAPERAHERDAMLDCLNASGLMCRSAWTPLHSLAIFAGSPKADLATAEDLSTRIINVPSSAGLANAIDLRSGH